MLAKLDETDIVYFSSNFWKISQILITAINSFAKISTEGYPILVLLVLIDRTTCQLTEESFTASSGLQFSCFLVFIICSLFS